MWLVLQAISDIWTFSLSVDINMWGKIDLFLFSYLIYYRVVNTALSACVWIMKFEKKILTIFSFIFCEQLRIGLVNNLLKWCFGWFVICNDLAIFTTLSLMKNLRLKSFEIGREDRWLWFTMCQQNYIFLNVDLLSTNLFIIFTRHSLFQDDSSISLWFTIPINWLLHVIILV